MASLKHIIILVITLIAINGFAQNDEIVTYYNAKNKVIKSKENAYLTQVLTKKSDSLWLNKIYRRNGTFLHIQHYKTPKKELKVGQSIVYGLIGNVLELTSHNANGDKHGHYKTWFPNGNLNTIGKYYKNKKHGLFTIYNTNKKLAGKAIFKNGSLTKEVYYDISGNITPINRVICSKLPVFRKGKNDYKKAVQAFVKNLDYTLKGSVRIAYYIEEDGRIKNVYFDTKVPDQIKSDVVNFFTNLKGWSAYINKNRTVPYLQYTTLKF